VSNDPVFEAPVQLTVNGTGCSEVVDVRISLADFLRDRLVLTGTHLGCEHGVCGACTVLVDGASVRSCLMLAVQAQDKEVTTVEGLALEGEYHPVQQAFHEQHGLQCGFCTPGFLMATCELLEESPQPTDDEIRQKLSGNICRCTGYQQILAAIRRAAELMTDR
jgi:aerobic carbon-monoxide dehydrogenase small subunit